MSKWSALHFDIRTEPRSAAGRGARLEEGLLLQHWVSRRAGALPASGSSPRVRFSSPRGFPVIRCDEHRRRSVRRCRLRTRSHLTRETTHDTAASAHDQRHDRSGTCREHQAVLPQVPSPGSPVTTAAAPTRSPPGRSRTTSSILHQKRGLSWKSCNCVRHGVRFLFRITLGVPDPHFYLPGAKTPSTLPEILNHDELGASVHRHHQPQASRRADDGLCRGAAGERTRTVARQRHRLRSGCAAAHRPGQGQQGPLRPALAPAAGQLREYWRRNRPEPWLFPNELLDTPDAPATGPGTIYHGAKEKAGIRKAGGIHTLRHYSRIRLIRERPPIDTGKSS